MGAVHSDTHGELQCQKHLFSLPPGVIYLNCASRSPMLRSVEEIGHQAVSLKKHPWRISDNGIPDKVRAQFAELIGVKAAEVALTPSTSYAISQVAHNILKLGRIEAGDVVIILQNQMSSNVYAWQRLCRESSAKLVAIRGDDSGWDEALERCIRQESSAGQRVAVCAVPHFLWTDGSGPVDFARLRKVLDELSPTKRSCLVVDATQSLGVVPIAVKSAGIDWLACSVHKWLFGPYGMSLVYAAEEWSSNPMTEPIVQDEHNRLGADGDICLPFEMSPVGYSEDFQDGAKKFDAGGRLNPILLPMVSRALQQVLDWTPERISSRLTQLTQRCVAGAQRLGLVTPRSHAPHLVGLSPPPEVQTPSEWADAACSYLKERSIHISSRAGCLRVAPHVYNNEADIDALLAALHGLMEKHCRVDKPGTST